MQLLDALQLCSLLLKQPLLLLSIAALQRLFKKVLQSIIQGHQSLTDKKNLNGGRLLLCINYKVVNLKLEI
jgi:hypothetical protein